MDPERKRQSALIALRAFFSQEQTVIDQNLDGLKDVLRENPDRSTSHDGLSKRQASRELEKLIHEGTARKIGASRNIRYHSINR